MAENSVARATASAVARPASPEINLHSSGFVSFSAASMGVAVSDYRRLLDKLRPVIFVPLHQMLEGEDDFGGGSNEFHSADLNQEDPSEQAGRHELHGLIRDRIQQLNRQQKQKQHRKHKT